MTDGSHAVVVGVYAQVLGSNLTAAAGIGATVLPLVNGVDFDEDGGYLVLNDVVLAYTECDHDFTTGQATITLAVPLAAAAAVDDRVDVWDVANGQAAVVNKAVVDQIDGFDGPATVVVSEGVAHALAQTMRDGTGESVTVSRDDDGDMQLTEVHGRAFALAALQYLQGGITTRSAENLPGVDILGVDSGIPGVYVYGNDNTRIVLRDDGSGGVIEGWLGIAGEVRPAKVNPGPSLSGPAAAGLELTSGTDIAAPWTAFIGLYSGNTGVGTATGPTVDINAAVTVGDRLTAQTVHGSTGLYDDSEAGNGTTSASMGNSGKVIRTVSSRRYKDDIEPLPLEVARRALDLEAVTFRRKDESDDLNRVTYPGFIAEQAADAGLDLWVSRDSHGRPDGIRYAELAAALIPIVRDQQAQIDALAARLERLEAETGEPR